MSDQLTQFDWDTILFALVCTGILLTTLFRLDEIFAAPKKRAKRLRNAVLLRRDGKAMLCDPDGHTWSRNGR